MSYYWASLMAQTEESLPAMLETWIGKIPWKREWLQTSAFLLENSMEKGAWWSTVHGIS